MENPHSDLYQKYMSFNQIMLEEYKPLEISAIMIIQALSIYRTVLNDEDYNKMIDEISNRRDQVKTFY